MHRVLCSNEAPEVRPSRYCFQPHDCEFWKRCTAHKPKDWIFYVPRISSFDFDELESFDVVSMRDIPNNFLLVPKQKRVVDAAKSRKVYRSPELAKILPPLAPPAGYLDFQTFSPAIPIYDNTRPYQRIPFEWSLDHDGGSGSGQSSDACRPCLGQAANSGRRRSPCVDVALALVEHVRGRYPIPVQAVACAAGDVA